MRIIRFFLGVSVFWLVACDGRRPGDPVVPKTITEAEVPVPVDTLAYYGDMHEEMQLYRTRLQEKICELDECIEAGSEQLPQGTTNMAGMAKHRQKLLDQLNRLELQTEARWQSFKAGLEPLLAFEQPADTSLTLK